ncbi:MAG: hypothetical protein PF440_07305 [Thiomicrorhabdus sp.]|jgi:hypothetical protein|nr:hypothetical protein [Thiomicrorhabdus sp.]
MSTESEVRDLETLRIAAGFDANRTYPSLFQWLGYRKLVAEQLLHERDEQTLIELRTVYEAVNNTIKRIIGI